jgi:hypothetical protein
MMTLVEHDPFVDVQYEEVSTFGSPVSQRVVSCFRVLCKCGMNASFGSLADANEACGRHTAGLIVNPVEADAVVRQEVDRQRDRMLETGDIFADC